MKDQLSCSKCDFRAPDKATRCPQCGGWIRRARRIRRLGVVMIFIGILLVGMMGTITALLAPMMLSAGTSTSGAKFEGTPEQGLLILSLFGLIIVFGLVAIAAGVFQVVTGRRSIWIVILVIGLALVLYVMATATRTALKRASVESQTPIMLVLEIIDDPKARGLALDRITVSNLPERRLVAGGIASSLRRSDMFIAHGLEKPPARFGGAELNVPNTNLVSLRPSEPRGVFCEV